MEEFPVIQIHGTPAEIGAALGRLAKPVLPAFLSESTDWRALLEWKVRNPECLQSLMACASRQLPDCWEELKGMAAGADMAIDDLFLWNCRHDVIPGLGTSVSIAANRLANALIGHNVNDDRRLQEHCCLVEVQPAGKPGFVGFYVPGSLPGYAFAANRNGLVHVMDAMPVAPMMNAEGVPSMLLCRALLDARSPMETLELADSVPHAGGSHHMIGWAGEFIMMSIELTPTTESMVPVPRNYAHANHRVHDPAAVPTAASQGRQARMAELLAALPDYPDEAELLSVLYDRQDAGAPIYCTATDAATGQATLASAIFRYTPDEIGLQVFGENRALLCRKNLPVKRD